MSSFSFFSTTLVPLETGLQQSHDEEQHVVSNTSSSIPGCQGVTTTALATIFVAIFPLKLSLSSSLMVKI